MRFDQPHYLWLLLLALPMAWVGWRWLRGLSPVRRYVALGIRLATLLVVVLALAGLEVVRYHHDLTVVAVVDESESMTRFAPRATLDPSDPQPVTTLGQWVEQWMTLASRDRRLDDRLGLVTYDNRPTVQVMPSVDATVERGVVTRPVEGSKAGAAIRLAMALLPADTARRIVWVSDGNDTAELDLLAAARQAASAGVAIDVLPVDYQIQQEVMIEGLYAPSQARQGQTAALRVVLRGTHPAPGQLYLMRNGQPVDLNGPEAGTAAPIASSQWNITRTSDGQEAGQYTLVKLIELPLADVGANRFEAIFEPAAQADAVVANNRASAFTLVRGQGQVLVLTNEPLNETRRLTDKLQSQGLKTQILPGTALPGDLAELSRYDSVILQNIPAELMDDAQQGLLTQYVSDIGGGLLVMGGPDSFGAGGWNNSTLSRIFPVDCELPAQLVLPTGALVLVIDRSGSMMSPVGGTAYSQQELAAEAAVMAISTLYPRDMIGVVAFDHAATWVTPLGYNNDRRAVMHQVRSITPSGGTNIYPGLEMAHRALASIRTDDAAVKHIIVLTDGHSDGSNYEELVQRIRQDRITVSTIGIGDGANSGLLQTIAQHGGGKFYPVDNPRKLPQVFIKEARTIRKNLIRETTFMPRLVASGSPLVSGVTHMPGLDGIVRTQRRSDPRVFNALLGPEDEPVLAHWQVGLGQVAAFTSDATTRWGGKWVEWDGYGDFWSRLVRAISRPASSRDLELTSWFEDDKLRLRLEATAAGGDGAGSGFAQLASVQAAVVAPDGQRQQVTLHQVGPGLYETQAQATESGSYLVSVLGMDAQGNRHFVSGGANRPPGMELRRFASRRALLEEVAFITGGRVLQAAPGQVTGLFSRDVQIPSSRAIRPLWRLLVWLLLPLFLLDVAVRRLTWDPGAIRAWLGLDRVSSVSDQAARALAAAKRKTQAVHAKPATTAAAQSSRAKEAAPPAAGASPIAQMQAQAQRKKQDAQQAQAGKAAEAKKNQEQAGGTSRLLDAKRRARQKLEEQ